MEEEDHTIFAHLNKNDFKTMIQKEVSEYKSEFAVFEQYREKRINMKV